MLTKAATVAAPASAAHAEEVHRVSTIDFPQGVSVTVDKDATSYLVRNEMVNTDGTVAQRLHIPGAA